VRVCVDGLRCVAGTQRWAAVQQGRRGGLAATPKPSPAGTQGRQAAPPYGVELRPHYVIPPGPPHPTALPVRHCNSCFLRGVCWDASSTYDALGPVGGRPVLMLHGALIGRMSMVHEARAMAEKGYRVLLPDLPGGWLLCLDLSGAWSGSGPLPRVFNPEAFLKPGTNSPAKRVA
jgi:pimeloyl-ACP methyl ester carboxylesterase